MVDLVRPSLGTQGLTPDSVQILSPSPHHASLKQTNVIGGVSECGCSGVQPAVCLLHTSSGCITSQASLCPSLSLSSYTNEYTGLSLPLPPSLSLPLPPFLSLPLPPFLSLPLFFSSLSLFSLFCLTLSRSPCTRPEESSAMCLSRWGRCCPPPQ